MQDKQIYEYAVIRVVPRVEREEFLNVGIILYCSKQGFLQAKYLLDKERISSFSKLIDLEELEKYLQTWEKICKGGKNGGSIGALPIASRFRWLTATRSTIVQTSKVHPGLCENAEQTMDCLFQELVA
ncbi:Protein of unknown function (DUF3037) [Arcicella aurantiaca]|uniref:DUF3037 family protein n=1 Tax=Arcicella aurantiaca TaxID=591202 RepID=A0A316E9Z9_9BACT|nr:DUF3037 domain-containing protein [Arcicella aurantiaca]PWK26924.1 Protein of unknown function (DUF3037) [Arcicella aurantiaca]